MAPYTEKSAAYLDFAGSVLVRKLQPDIGYYSISSEDYC